MTPDHFVVHFSCPAEISGASRDAFLGVLSEYLVKNCAGFAGLHQGTVLSEEAADKGFETESWVLDAGIAPHARDWVSSMEDLNIQVYFVEKIGADQAANILREQGFEVEVTEEIAQDWNAEWRRQFEGLVLEPHFEIILPDNKPTRDDLIPLILNPGAGFGTGTHETTQLCLTALASYRKLLRGSRVLDFGSGSGILTVASRVLGASTAIGVEIDPLAIDNAFHNAKLNGFEKDPTLQFLTDLDAAKGEYPVIVANILKPILLEFSPKLIAKLPAKGPRLVVLSGLVAPDLEAVETAFMKAFKGISPRLHQKNEWFCLEFYADH